MLPFSSTCLPFHDDHFPCRGRFNDYVDRLDWVPFKASEVSETNSRLVPPVLPVLKFASQLRLALLFPLCLCLAALAMSGVILLTKEKSSADAQLTAISAVSRHGSASADSSAVPHASPPAHTSSHPVASDVDAHSRENQQWAMDPGVLQTAASEDLSPMEARLQQLVLKTDPEFDWRQPAEILPADIRLISDEQSEQLVRKLEPDAIQDRIPIDLAQIDALILKGNYGFAAELLQEFDARTSGVLKGHIRLRQGLCAELLGNPSLALKFYRSLLKTHASSAISDTATVACARNLLELGHHDVVTPMLMGLLLARERVLEKETLGDVTHLLALSMSVANGPHTLLDDNQWMIPVRHPGPEEILQRWKLTEGGRPELNAADEILVRRLTSSPQGVLVTAVNSRLSVERVLARLCKELEWTLVLDDAARRAFVLRVAAIDCEEVPLDVILDCLLQPHGFRWSYLNSRLSVSTVAQTRQESAPATVDSEPDTVTDNVSVETGATVPSLTPNTATTEVAESSERERQRLEIAERFQQLAVSLAPEHPRAPGTYLMLGATAAARDELERAISYFKTTLELFPRSSAVGAATFNLGKALLAQGRRDDALAQFYRTVDGASGLGADAVGYLYIGRILLENDTAHDAISPLMRGLSLAEETAYEGPATVLLSAAYLMSGNAEAANQVLVDHRTAFAAASNASAEAAAAKRKISNHAAFLSSLARFWGSQGRQRIREGHALLSSLTNVRAEDMFGQHSGFLIGVAFGAVGLHAEQAAVFRRSLAAPHAFPLQNRIRLLLSGRVGSSDSLDPEVTQETQNMTAAAASDTGRWLADRQAKLAQAEAAVREGQHAKALSHCRELLLTRAQGVDEESDEMQQEQQIRRTALRIAGLVFQDQGLHQEAVRCFTGTLPEAFLSSDGVQPDSTSASPQTSKGAPLE